MTMGCRHPNKTDADSNCMLDLPNFTNEECPLHDVMKQCNQLSFCPTRLQITGCHVTEEETNLFS